LRQQASRGFPANGGVVTKLAMLANEGAIVNFTPSLSGRDFSRFRLAGVR